MGRRPCNKYKGRFYFMKRIFILLEKGGDLMPPSAQAVREHSLLTGFSFMELMVVLIIIAILCILALSPFTKAREIALDKEAQANLRLIQAGEIFYRMDATVFQAFGNTGAINSGLSLDIPTATNWNYMVDSITPVNFRAKAVRSLDNRVWCIRKNDSAPSPADLSHLWCN